MRHLYRRFQSWVWNLIHPEWDEPPRDETTPQVIADWVAKHRHPPGCAGGCQCEQRGGGD